MYMEKEALMNSGLFSLERVTRLELGSNLIVVDSIALEGFKTKAVVEMLKALGADKKALILMPELDQKLVKSAANIPGVKTALVNTINVYDLVNCDKFIVCKDAVAKLEEVYA